MTIDINARKIDLSNQDLKEIPEEIFKCKRLRKLNLSGNQISKIPKEIENLKGLSVLDLSNNEIKYFYAPIGKLKNLRILILNNNNIRSIPAQIENLKKLKILGLASNKLKELPIEITKLEQLEEINVSYNCFEKVPMYIEGFSSIKRIWIKNCPGVQEHVFMIDLMNDCKIYKGKRREDKINEPSSEKKEAFKQEKVVNMRNSQSNSMNNEKVVSSEKKTIFISYSHADKKWFDRLKVHLSTLENLTGNKIKVWSDRELKGGDNIPEEIAKALKNAVVAVLMFSPDFLNSDFIKRKEIPPILKRAKENGTTMKPILVKPCLYKHLPDFKDILAMNDLNEPLSKMTQDQNDEIFNKLNEEIIELFNLKFDSFE